MGKRSLSAYLRLFLPVRNCAFATLLSWWRHQMETFSALLALCAGIHRWPVNSPHRGQWRGALMFSLIFVWINGWVNNREACDLRRHQAHYDVTVMVPLLPHVEWRHNNVILRTSTGVSIVYWTVCSIAEKQKNIGVNGLWEGNSPVTGDFSTQRASIAENVSIWWRHHDPRHPVANPLWYCFPKLPLCHSYDVNSWSAVRIRWVVS